MTKAQIKWAQQHDWFKGTRTLGTGDVQVAARDRAANDATGEWEEQTVHFSSFRELVHWAGY